MSSEKLWAIFWGSVIIIIASTVVGLVVVNQHDTARRESAMLVMISKGSTPIEARCAVYGVTGDNDNKSALICQAAALGKTPQEK